MKRSDSVRPSQPRWRVLVIDDSADDRAEVRRLLLKGSPRVYEFVECETAADGLAALTDDSRGPPDCVVLDYHLPDGDAPQVLESFTDASGGALCPVVVVTGQDDEEIGRAVLRAGAQDFVGKSWMTPQSLTRALENAKERWVLAQEVRLGENRLRGLANAVPQPVWIRDVRARGSVYVNQLWHARFGDVSGEPDSKWRTLLHPDEVESVLGQLERAAAAGEPYQLEARLRLVDGTYRFHQLNAAPIRGVDGKITHWSGVSTDIHELKESDARLRLALEASKTGIWTWELPTGAVTWTAECYEIHGLLPGNFAGTGDAFFTLVHPADRHLVERAVRTAIAERSLYSLEFRIVQPGGAVKWVQNLGRASYDNVGNPLRMLGTITDIDDRKLADAALAAREHQLQMLADNTPDIIARFDRERRHVFVNAAAAKAAGRSQRELLGRTNREIGMPETLCLRWDAALDSVLRTGDTVALEFDVDTGSGARSYASRLVPETSEAGEVAFVLAIVTDVTQRKRIEDSLRASEDRLVRAQRAAHAGT
ncbi:MAG: luxQ 10, partial [Polyangiaceae bacterium]|nr:luxQ 10 [Polyangiaceae bacterium]